MQDLFTSVDPSKRNIVSSKVKACPQFFFPVTQLASWLVVHAGLLLAVDFAAATASVLHNISHTPAKWERKEEEEDEKKLVILRDSESRRFFQKSKNL